MQRHRLRRSAPDLNDVALFVEVVRAVSFSAVAKQRGVPVSTVSRRIARLETALGMRLLERTTRRLRLTDVGRTYFAHAERAVDELQVGRDRVNELDELPRGRVRITAPIGLGHTLVGALARFVEDTPSVAIEIDLSERRVDLLAEGFDLALRAGPVDTADFTGRKLVESTRQLFASPAYLERRGRPKRIADLSAHSLISTRATATGATWDLLETNGRRHRFSFKPHLLVNELMAAQHAAAAGIGIVMLPSLEIDRSELERVLPRVSGPAANLWLLYPAHRNLTAAVRACVDHLLVALPLARPPTRR